MIVPARAPVRPRVILPEGNGTILLEDVVADIQGRSGAVLIIVGGIGWGKTVALAHLAACFGGGPKITFLDEPSIAEVRNAREVGNVVIAVRLLWKEPFALAYHKYTLAPWTNDDLIEYLLAKHPRQCGSVMRRIARAPDRTMHHGRPELCVAVVDRMAEDEGLPTVAAALRSEIGESLATRESLKSAQRFCIATLAQDGIAASESYKALRAGLSDERAFHLLRHDPVQLLLAADGLAAALESPRRCPWLKYWLPRGVVELSGPLLSTTAIAHLRRELRRKDKSRHSVAASLIHAAGQGWTPDRDAACDLTGAYLAGSNWAGLRAKGLVLNKSDMSGSDLKGAALESLAASRTVFTRAVLREAWLINLHAWGADFQSADLSSINAERSSLESADFTNAILTDAALSGAVLRCAVLTGARFDNANLSKAVLRRAIIDGASFEGANFEEADLTELSFRSASINGAKFVRAKMSNCDFEEIEALGVNFAWADLLGANFTSARMPGANFSHAILKGAKLGDVNWEGADLTHANLSQCTFHFGSSRSGLVGSPIASEGSRMGFYTDDYDQQLYRPPEEIRKANLCGVDLTGADLRDTDFYLVDLRRAKYTPDQFEHLRRCRAILFDRE